MNDTDGTCDLESTQCSQVHASKHGPPPKLGTFGLRVELPQLVDFLARHEIALELVRPTGLIFRGSRVSGRAPAIQGCVAILAQRSVRAAVAAASR
jgi:hypothetical protein